MKNSILKYPPGSDWLYIKIYGGPHALEEWMAGPFRELLSEWEGFGLINLFHYVHYLDPEYHLRMRFLLSDPVQSGLLLNQVQQLCSNLLEEDLIWKIEVGTYEPEYGRYGRERMSLVENWFEIDSLYWLDEIHRRVYEDETEIWKGAIRSIDAFLDDFSTAIDDKTMIINKLRESAAADFRINKSMKLQLDEKYRKISGELASLLDTAVIRSDEHLVKRSADSSEIIHQIQESFRDHQTLIGSSLLPDLIHMSLNRAFRTRHRLQELVIYDFLGRYYESTRARMKNSH